MMTRTMIEKILPKALPLALGFSIVYSPVYSTFKAFAADNVEPASLSMESASDSATAVISGTARKAPKSLTRRSSGKQKTLVVPKEVSAKAIDAGDSKVKELIYNESNVYVIRTKYGYQTNVVFDPKEEVQTVSVGDRSLWQIIPAGNRLFIRPMTENISTNMTLLTNKRSYEFDLKSVPENNDSNVYVLKFTYPEANPFSGDNHVDMIVQNSKVDAIAEVKPAAQKEISPEKSVAAMSLPEVAKPESIGLLPIRFNYSYTYSGPDAIAPTQVYDDGKSTFIKYKSISKVAPDAFIIESDGRETKVPAEIKGSSLVIDTVTGEIALRSADGEIRIYNESGGR